MQPSCELLFQPSCNYAKAFSLPISYPRLYSGPGCWELGCLRGLVTTNSCVPVGVPIIGLYAVLLDPISIEVLVKMRHP